jgi:hypothetical protein
LLLLIVLELRLICGFLGICWALLQPLAHPVSSALRDLRYFLSLRFYESCVWPCSFRRFLSEFLVDLLCFLGSTCSLLRLRLIWACGRNFERGTRK